MEGRLLPVFPGLIHNCDKHVHGPKAQGISEQTWYRWKKKFGQMEVPDVRRLRELEKENVRLKRLVAERDLEIDAMKEVLKANF